MADGALARFEADTAVAITGVAGPGRRDRGEAGRLRLLVRVKLGRRALSRDARLPGDRAEVRDRSTTVAMHLLRRRAARGGLRSLSGPRARMFVALDLPAAARSALAAWRDALVDGRATCGRSPPSRST